MADTDITARTLKQEAPLTDRTERFYARLMATGVADLEPAMLRLLKTADAHDDALAAIVTLFDRIAATLEAFYVAPLSMASVQPILTLAEELNPGLKPTIRAQFEAQRADPRRS